MPHSCDHRAPSFRKRESWLGWQFVIRLDLLFISSALGSALAGAEPHLCCTLTGREPANTCHFYRSTRISGDDNVGVWENIHMCVFTWDWRTSKLCMCVCVEWIFPIGKFFFFFFFIKKEREKRVREGGYLVSRSCDWPLSQTSCSILCGKNREYFGDDTRHCQLFFSVVFFLHSPTEEKDKERKLFFFFSKDAFLLPFLLHCFQKAHQVSILSGKWRIALKDNFMIYSKKRVGLLPRLTHLQLFTFETNFSADLDYIW